MWDQSRYALEFFNQYVPFWRMQSFACSPATTTDFTTTSDPVWCLSDERYNVVVVYIHSSGTALVHMPAGLSFHVAWFDPMLGGELQQGSVSTLHLTGEATSVGRAPHGLDQDWVVLLQCTTGCDLFRLNESAMPPSPSRLPPAPTNTIAVEASSSQSQRTDATYVLVQISAIVLLVLGWV